MKYMGSKSWMLKNGLGLILNKECTKAGRFVDLFAGSGAVSCFVARNLPVPVFASDLQEFSSILINAIIARQTPVDPRPIWNDWIKKANEYVSQIRLPKIEEPTRKIVEEWRGWSERKAEWPITKAYGGHYFNPIQATWIDALRWSIPTNEPSRTITLASLIFASSQCVASPGHTAQPFQPTRRARKYLIEAWAKDVPCHTRQALGLIAPQCAIRTGVAVVADANEAVKTLRHYDIAFIDPPYSSVQYSRFYHVLETVAKGEAGEVSGAGRYPSRSVRPQSQFSLKAHSRPALIKLLRAVADKEAKAILTFPSHECSNGLSGAEIIEIADRDFHITVKKIQSKFSTLGGNNRIAKIGGSRKARQSAEELIISLTPRC